MTGVRIVALGLRFMALWCVLAAILLGYLPVAQAADPTFGATGYTFHGKDQWWRNIGPETELTVFNGPYINAILHQGQLYITFWKMPDATAHAKGPIALDPKSVQTLDSLGTTFFYAANQPAPPDPATLGYTAEDFAIADRLTTQFPKLDGLFPKGLMSVGCQRGNAQFFLIQGKSSASAFLVAWSTNKKGIDVAVIPAKVLAGSLESILDNLNYYSFGGMIEFMSFGGHYYYLSRLPKSDGLDVSEQGTAAAQCPETPVAGKQGIEYPQSWLDAVAALNKKSP